MPYIFAKLSVSSTSLQTFKLLGLTHVAHGGVQVEGEDHDAVAHGERCLGTTYIFGKLVIRAIKVPFMITLEFCQIKKLFCIIEFL